jgi:hypothetical protein
MNSQYETLYGVGLLDDLHNYFPAILYEPQSFHSVGTLLRYVQQQTRNRFDLFSLGQREYRSSHSPVPPPPPVPSSVSSVRLQATSDLSGNPIVANSILPNPNQRVRLPVGTTNVHYTFNLSEEEEEEEEDMAPNVTAQLVAALLQLPLRGRTGPDPIQQLVGRVAGMGGGMDAFLQPVPVRPTQEQIDTNSTVGNLVSDTEHTCAICQDVLTAEQEGRKLNACGHWFHRNCIDTWLEGNVHCPVCRHDIRESIRTEAP